MNTYNSRENPVNLIHSIAVETFEKEAIEDYQLDSIEKEVGNLSASPTTTSRAESNLKK